MGNRITFKDLMDETIGSVGGKIAFEYFKDKKNIKSTGYEYISHINAMANYLAVCLKSVEIGKWVVLKAPNSIYWFGVMFALMKCGYKVILVDAQNSKELNEHFTLEADVKAFITDKPANIEGVLDVNITDVESVDDKEIFENADRYPMVGDELWSSKLSFHTSGSTGTAKIYVFSAESIVNTIHNISDYWLNNECISHRTLSNNRNDNKSLLVLPFRHISGFLLVVTLWHLEYRVIFPPNNGIFSIIETCKNERIWMMFCVPAMWKGLLRIAYSRYGENENDSLSKLLGENLKIGISAGAKLDAETVKALLNSKIYFLNSWGMTEVGTSTMGGIDEDKSLDYVGTFYNKHKVKVRLKNGTYKDEGVGELVLDGHSLYESVFIEGKEVPREGEFSSGDIFQIKGNRAYFLGRCKSVIVSDTGENVYPEEIDVYFSFLSEYSTGYCIAGYNDQVSLFINPNVFDGFAETECFKKIRTVNSTLPINKRVENLFIMKNELPRTSKGEVARFKMNELINKGIDEYVKIPMKGRKL